MRCRSAGAVYRPAQDARAMLRAEPDTQLSHRHQTQTNSKSTTGGTTRPIRRSNTVRTTADFHNNVFLIFLAAQATDFKNSGRFGKTLLPNFLIYWPKFGILFGLSKFWCLSMFLVVSGMLNRFKNMFSSLRNLPRMILDKIRKHHFFIIFC